MISVDNPSGKIELRKDDARPTYAQRRSVDIEDAFGVVPWKDGETLANYPLFEASIQRAKVPWTGYNGLTSEERTVYMAHLRAVKLRKLDYKCPLTGFKVMTVSKLLLNKSCCGNACRHCPYEHENVPKDIKGSKIWNGAYYV